MNWIKCSDRLPEDYVTVLAWGPITDIARTMWLSNAYGIAQPGRRWSDGEDYLDLSEFTHWQPLPKPPEGV